MARLKNSADKVKGGRKGNPNYFKVNNPNRAYGRKIGSIGKAQKDAFGDFLRHYGKENRLKTELDFLKAKKWFYVWQLKCAEGWKGREYRSRQFKPIPMPIGWYLLYGECDGKYDKYENVCYLVSTGCGTAIVQPALVSIIRERQSLKRQKVFDSINRKLSVVCREIEKLSVPVFVPDFQI
jgi:hypothetical protein